MMVKATHWLAAFRPRTLPLSFSCILTGAALAYAEGAFDAVTLLLTLVTTLFLQILSNVANDYGDSLSGVDGEQRTGPGRAVQTGKISVESMRNAVFLFVFFSLASGVGLLFHAFPNNRFFFFLFLTVGIAAIFAAVRYTVGKNPYGYTGMGDFFVLLFFGIVGVAGSFFLQTQYFKPEPLLPAVSCGLFATGVLNINNIRDMDADKSAGKKSIPVRIGREKSVYYHAVLIGLGWLAAGVYSWLTYSNLMSLFYFLSLPLFFFNVCGVGSRSESSRLDPLVKQLVLSILAFIILFCVSILPK